MIVILFCRLYFFKVLEKVFSLFILTSPDCDGSGEINNERIPRISVERNLDVCLRFVNESELIFTMSPISIHGHTAISRTLSLSKMFHGAFEITALPT